MITVGETNPAAAEVPFWLPQTGNPSLGLLNHDFSSNDTLGEVQMKLPGALTWLNVPHGQIVEKGPSSTGFGRYVVQLTSAQTGTPGTVWVRVRLVGDPCQPARVSEIIGANGGDLGINGDDYIPFFLANGTDPIFGSPITGHVFTLGEVKVCLPGTNAYTNVALTDIKEIGDGLYGARMHGTSTATRGKAYIAVNVSGSQLYENYINILDPLSGILDIVAPVLQVISPPVGSIITPFQSITFRFYDETGLRRALPAVRFNKADGTLDHYEIIHDGDNFTPDYSGTRTVLTDVGENGWEYTVLRRGGWAATIPHTGGSPILVPFGTDTSGNEVAP